MRPNGIKYMGQHRFRRCPNDTKPLPEPILRSRQLDRKKHISIDFYIGSKALYSQNMFWELHLL